MGQFGLILTASAICVVHSAFAEYFIHESFADPIHVIGATRLNSMSKELTKEEVEKSKVEKPRLAASEPFADKPKEAPKVEGKRTFEEERRRREQQLLEEHEKLLRQEREQEVKEERKSDAVPQYKTRLRELDTLIEMEISAPVANEPKQCKLIAFGSKPCGGPWRYLVYSTATANEVRLKQLVNEYNQLERKLNKEQKIRSTCEYVREPSVAFVSGVCAIKDK